MSDLETLRGSGGTRLAWEQLPESLRTTIEDKLGAAVMRADSQKGGFSPGLAARLTLADGRRVFVKAVSPAQNPDAPRFYRQEAEIAARLPESVPAPRLLWCHDDGHWVVLAFEDVDGRTPAMPWQPDEQDRVLAALAAMAAALTPCPVDVPEIGATTDADLSGWRQLVDGPPGQLAGVDPWARERVSELAELEARWALVAAGDSLLHGDLRADNMLLTDERVVFVDWPSALRGAPWFDLLILLPSMTMQGGGDPQRIIAMHPLTRDVDPASIDAVLAAVAGYFVHSSLQPPPPGLPRVRDFQRAQGEAVLPLLRQRLTG